MTWVKTHHACPDVDKCGSSDGASTDQDGVTFCFVCNKQFRGAVDVSGKAPDNYTPRAAVKPALSVLVHQLMSTDAPGCPSRGITAATAALYKTLHLPDKTLYGYFSKDDATNPCAIKTRLPEKHFPWAGDHKAALLFGLHLFSGGGKYITITEGEEDAMAAYQLQGSKYPVVSLKDGAGGALNNCKAAYEWLDTFECIVVSFDNDEAGSKAAKEVAQLFGGKSKIMRHPQGIKDACEYYQKGRTAEFMTSFWRAERYIPDGIISAGSLREKLKAPVPAPDLRYPWQGMNKMLRGMYDAQLITWCAGSGVGKSSVLREIVLHTLQHSQRHVGLAFLEETPERTLRGLAGLYMGKRIHLDGVSYTPEEIDTAFNVLGLDTRVALWDHWGSSQIDSVISRLRYMAKAMDCKLMVLDHISIVVSGAATQNERQTLDELMTRLRTEVVQQTGCTLHVISHLTRPDGKPLEEGAKVTLSLLRGSGAIAQLSDAVVAVERNTQDDDREARNVLTLRVLKDRHVGDTGVACLLRFDRQTGRMVELEETL